MEKYIRYIDLRSTHNNNGSLGSITGPGINCGSDCTESYTENTEISLSAIAAWDSRFTGWSGACIGDEACILNMTGNKSITATFDIRLPPVVQCYPGMREVSNPGPFTEDTYIQSMDKIETVGAITTSKHVRLIFEAANGITAKINPAKVQNPGGVKVEMLTCSGIRYKKLRKLFLDTRSPAGTSTQIVQFGTTHITTALHCY
jgi:hypothetical protein